MPDLTPPEPVNCFTCTHFSLDPWGCTNRNAYPACLSDGALACTRYEKKPTAQPTGQP